MGLGVEDEDEAELEEDPADVDSHVLPANGLEGNGVDVGGEEASQFAENLLDSDTHSPLGIREEFHKVGCRMLVMFAGTMQDKLTVCQGVVADVVTGRVCEVPDKGRDGGGLVGIVTRICDGKALEGDGHGDENKGHAARGQHKHPSALEARNDECDDCAVEQTPALIGNVDPGLCEAGGITHHLEKQVGVVRKQRVSAHLGEKTHHGGDEYTAAHTSGSEHIHPRLPGVLQLELDGGSNLGHLSLDNGRICIALGVVFGKDCEGLVFTVFADKPSGAFGEHTVDMVRFGAFKTDRCWLTRQCKPGVATGKSATEMGYASSSLPRYRKS